MLSLSKAARPVAIRGFIPTLRKQGNSILGGPVTNFVEQLLLPRLAV
jgi:hypothetical protein